ncbi:Ger(x)C family spore germination protein [Anaerobacillus alkaliphilus]|uniref:Ger(X)C family spore germination protein n=1 Tax=Anaerobacillus alkaliphilus TaxID=1548597 RepID=A0A4Q0VWN3_9BACI|nr:Ger(x)C family spore germination protein [Anaerobacillus alkaliphilus]RXJ01944.1 Ger(x)C family spore germination protein [Anaerobacillus alkaliphilus]
MKLVKLSLVPLAIILMLTGCIDDAREIDHRSMIVGMGIDVEENNDNEILYSVTLQIPILLTGGREGSPAGSVKEFETFTATGKTILDAVAHIEAMTPTVLFFGHLKVVTVSEHVASHGLDRVIDFFDRLPQVANQIFLLVIEDGKVEEFINQESPLVNLPALYLNRFFQAEQKISRTKDVKLFEYRRDTNMISGAATLPLAKILDKKILIEGMAVLHNHKLVAKLERDEVGISELLKNNRVDNVNYTITLETNVGEEEVSITRGNLQAKFHYEETTPLTVNISVKGKGEIAEVGTPEVRVTNDLVKEANDKMEKEIKELVTKTIKRMQAENVEPWLIGHRLWVKDPDFFDTLHWEESGWRETVVNVSVDFKMEHTGQKGYLGKRKIGR